MQQMPNSTLIFHVSNNPKPTIAPASPNRPMFFWFNDCYHDHYNFDVPGMTYLYLFLIKPEATDVKLFTRHGNGDFKSMWGDYTRYLDKRTANEQTGIKEYLEPGIAMSFSELIPDVTCNLSDDFSVIAQPRNSEKQTSFSLVQDGRLRRFDDIPELVNLLPGINGAVPIVKPSPLEIDDPRNFWPADTENQGRKWL